ncbi:MAG: transposase [Candidatus Levybacteria bacterium]|nr:transposase [Candidatus Levybacteria bacterium]
MADRKFPIVTGHFYHIFNRGVASQPTFMNKRDYEQAMLTLSYYRFKNPPIKLSRLKDLSIKQREDILSSLERENETWVKFVSFSLMPNHFHFLLFQNQDNGITNFISKFTNSYTKYINTKNIRNGPLFSGVYKSVLVETDEQLIHVSRYIHLNPIVSLVIKEQELFTYPWSSLSDFLKGGSSLVWANPVIDQFKSSEDYRQFVLDQVDYGKKLEQIKHLVLE